MASTSNLHEIVSKQKEIIANLQKEIDIIDNSDLELENKKLSEQLEITNKKLKKVSLKAEETEKEYQHLHDSYTAQLLQEKLTILNTVNKRIQQYYLPVTQQERNRLYEFEITYKEKINSLSLKLQNAKLTADEELQQQIAELTNNIDLKIKQLKELETAAKAEFNKDYNEKLNELGSEGVTDEELEKSLSRRGFESFVGLNLFNKIGIFLIVIGTIAAGRYTFTKIGDVAKAAVIYLLGAGLIAAGEIVAAKKHNANIFSQGLISGGVAVLYVATVVTYFALDLITPELTFLLCVIITAIAFFLSAYHKSQTISAFAIIGGYLPIISLFFRDMSRMFKNPAFLPVIIAYVSLLCLFSFLISIKNKWVVSLFIGFSLNFVAISGISLMTYNLISINNNSLFGIIPIGFTVFSMIVYFLDCFIGSRKKDLLSTEEFILVLINSVASSSSLFVLFSIFFPKKLYIVAIFLCAIFALLKWFAATYLSEDKNINYLFVGLAVLLSYSIVPLTWGADWLPLAWLIESAAIVIFATYKNNKVFKFTGFAALYLSIALVYILDVFNQNVFISNSLNSTETALISYPALVIASIIIVVCAITIDKIDESIYEAFLGVTLFNTISFVYFITDRCIDKFTLIINDVTGIKNVFAWQTIFIIISLAIILATTFIDSIKFKSIRILNTVFTSVGFIMFSILLFEERYNRFNYFYSTLNKNVISNIVFMIIAFAIIVATTYFVTKALCDEFDFSDQIVAAAPSVVFVLMLTFILTEQFNIRFTHPIISIIYVIAAALWIAFGFIKRYSALRKSGLILTFVALAKLFFVDLFHLPLVWRIISFFAFGIILIGVSFVYQYFSKRLEKNVNIETNNQIGTEQ